ncbi:YbhB/YbcL family Raf kinase inhibitor-like protein [Melioribacteraceae bacterium 4301-Me]|uniref:YbhB/YbcL family Raf kinase inhibitor-like protein n=1 Tax=Pyranulibacter aquaticus TaxID=3163344 RepID=UPI0035989039
MKKYFLFVLSIIIISQDCIAQQIKKEKKMKFQITSTAFKYGELIPVKYTCDGINISPPLKWEGVPTGTKSLALICDDPDAPIGDWVHWVIYFISPTLTELREGIPKGKEPIEGIKQGTTDFHYVGYGGPCPPSGTHRYFFKLYALDTILNLDSSTTKKTLLEAMKNHIIDKAELMGTYKRTK